MNRNALAEIRAAHRGVGDAQRHLSQLVREEWPEDSYVEVPFGNGVKRGVIIQHSGDQMRIRLASTGRPHWIYHFHLYGEAP